LGFVINLCAGDNVHFSSCAGQMKGEVGENLARLLNDQERKIY
jgi:hypothetical protein